MFPRRPWAMFKPDGDAGGADGLGGDTAVAAASDIPDDPDYSAGPEFEMGQAFGGQQQHEETDLWELLGDEAKELAEKKGWDSPEQMLQSYREMERKQGAQGDENGRLAAMQARIDQLDAALRNPQPVPAEQQNPYAPPGQGDPIDELFSGVDFEKLNELAGGDPGVALNIYQDQVMLPRLRALMGGMAGEIIEQVRTETGQRVQPLENLGAQVQLRDQAQTLARQFPDEFSKYREEVQQEMLADRSLLHNPKGMHIAFGQVMMRHLAEERARASRAQEGETLAGGQRPSPARSSGPDEKTMLRQAIASAMPALNDGL